MFLSTAFFLMVQDKYRMRAKEIYESSEKDFDSLQKARQIVNAFVQFLLANPDTPVKNLPNVRQQTIKKPDTTQKLYYFDVSRLISDFPAASLYLGFTCTIDDNQPDGEAVFLNARSGRDRLGFALFQCETDIGDEVDVIWKFSANNLVHEVVHYFDFIRFKGITSKWSADNIKRLKITDRDVKLKLYFNTNKEMNAYFMGGVSDIVDQIIFLSRKKRQDKMTNVLQTFANFNDYFLHVFHPGWLQFLNETNKKKFNKRFYVLYKFIKDHYPDIPLIQAELAHLAAIDNS